MSLLEQKSRIIFEKYGFEELRTPVFEDANLFVRSIGNMSDIVEKEMYIFKDKKKRRFVLRPEGTAPLIRAFIEHKMDISVSVGKFFYIGEMFRYERPQTGRYRQFHQIGAEFLGNSSPAADVEIILLVQDLLFSVGINKISVHINSLGCEKCSPFYKEALIKYFSSVQDLCKDCMRRLKKSPLRLLDCKIDSCNFIGVPKTLDYLCDDCKNSLDLVQLLLKSVKCTYIIDEKLVRGLDYYTKTVFEFRSDYIGSQSALAAGGRYDNLVEELGGKKTPAVGFALGSERVLLAAQDLWSLNSFKKNEKIFIAIADQELFDKAFVFAVKIIRNGLCGNKKISVFGPVNGKNLTKQLKFASKIQVSRTIIFAKTEIASGIVLIKNMNDKTQIEVPVNDL
jgi:histidyl-tRNA synthetase